MLQQPGADIIGDGQRLAGFEIVVHHHRVAFGAQLPVLPGFLIGSERGVADLGHVGANFNFRAQQQRCNKIHVNMRHDQIPLLKQHLRIEKAEKRVAAQLKPDGQAGVVDVPQAIGIAKARGYGFGEHVKKKMVQMNRMD